MFYFTGVGKEVKVLCIFSDLPGAASPHFTHCKITKTSFGFPLSRMDISHRHMIPAS